MEKIFAKVAKLIVTAKIRAIIVKLIEATQVEQTKDIVITLADNGYQEAADFIRANYR